jgi:D-serine deaminase-like pyridoxal phosphate-dependent protein
MAQAQYQPQQLTALIARCRRQPVSATELAGDGISHPCTTADQWQWIVSVNDNDDVVSAIRTFF